MLVKISLALSHLSVCLSVRNFIMSSRSFSNIRCRNIFGSWATATTTTSIQRHQEIWRNWNNSDVKKFRYCQKALQVFSTASSVVYLRELKFLRSEKVLNSFEKLINQIWMSPIWADLTAIKELLPFKSAKNSKFKFDKFWLKCEKVFFFDEKIGFSLRLLSLWT